MTTIRRLQPAFLVVLGTLALPVATRAQPGQPCATPAMAESITLSQADKDKLRACVESNKEGLAGDADQIKRARRAVGGIFDSGANISVSFRIEMARVLIPVLKPLIADKRDIVAANALQLAGEVATTDSIPLLTEGLASKNPAVRYGAAYGFKRLFDQLRSSSPAFNRSEALAACNAVAAAVAGEKDARVLEGYARALEAAAIVPSEKEQIAGLRAAAVAAVAKEFGARLRAKDAGSDLAAAAIRAGSVLRDAATNQRVGADEPPLPQATLKEVAGMGGDLIAFANRHVQAGNLVEADRAALAGVADVGYSVYFFAAGAMKTTQVKEEEFSTPIREEKDKDFAQKAAKFIGPDGALTKAPFSFSAERFK